MKKIIMVCFCLLVLASCKDEVEETLNQQAVGPVIAEVGDKKFYETDIDFEIMSMPESMRYIMQDDAARAQVLDVMIKREVVAQKAQEMGLNLDPLIAYRMRQAEDMVLIQSVREWQDADLQAPTDAEIKAYYKTHADNFIIPKQVHGRHILVADKQTALEILKQLRASPDSFATLAAQFSIDDSTKGRGGDLNWFAHGDMLDAFEKVAFALTEKKPLSKPVKTKFGWHIIEWLGEREQQTPAFEDIKAEISSELAKEKLNMWVENLMRDADSEVKKSEYRIN